MRQQEVTKFNNSSLGNSRRISDDTYVKLDVATDTVAYCIARIYALPADAMSCGNVSLYLARRSFVLSLLELRDRVHRGDEDAMDVAIALGKWFRSVDL